MQPENYVSIRTVHPVMKNINPRTILIRIRKIKINTRNRSVSQSEPYLSTDMFE